MEDYSTVIWIIVIVVAMIFNATSQARKKAKKQAHETEKHTQHEAWPSWDSKSAEEMRHPDSQETIPGTETAELQPATLQSAPADRLEEMARETADFRQEKRHAPLKTTPASRHTDQEILHEDHSAGNSHTTEEAVTEITEDFNLSKAVIYSEILKSKFSEE